MFDSSLRKFIKVTFGSKKRVILLFLVSLGVPSVFLFLLAIRGIENDKALAERKLLSEHRTMAISLITEVDIEISRFETGLKIILQESSKLGEADILDILAKFASDAFIDEVFIFRNDNMEYPLANLLYHIKPKQALGQIQQSRMDDVRHLIEEAERNEFQINDYARAEELYISALNATGGNDVKANLYMRIARVSAQRGNLNRALKMFSTVFNRYSKSILPGGLPGGLAARLEFARFSVQNGNYIEGGEALVEIYHELLYSDWNLTKSQFIFIREKIESLATSLKEIAEPSVTNYNEKIDELGIRTDSLESHTEYLLEIELAASPIILDCIRQQIENSNTNKRLVIEGNDKEFLLIISRAENVRKNGVYALGAILKQSILVGNILPNIIQDISPDDNTKIMIIDANGAAIYGSQPLEESRLTITLPFAGDFLPWSIELYQNDPNFFEQLLSARQSFYIYALIIVMLAMTFGAIMTARMMNRELELARLKSDFVSTVSHEFRSPLTSIRQLSEMLQSGRVISESRRKQYYDIILQQSERLSLLVNNILDLARIDEKRFSLDMERVNLNELLNNIIMQAKPQGSSDEFPISLQIDGQLPEIFIDPGAITNIMNNLIDNAIKYSDKFMNVSITARRENNQIVITVADQGIGIPKDEFEKVFERFYRTGDELTRKVKGSGLGLSLVRELVKAHNGTVGVSSEINKGSVFTIRLPLLKDKEA